MLSQIGVTTITPIPASPISSAPAGRRSNSRQGIVLMLCAMFLFAASDMLSKLLTDSFHPVQIIWFRQSGLFAGVVVFLLLRGTAILRSSRPCLQITRGVLVICSSTLFVFAVRYVPLADAVAASFVAPFFVTILGATVLKEKVGVRRWAAVLAGFLGALVIVRPGMGVIHPAVLLVVLAAALYSARQVIGRLVSDKDKAITTVAFTALTSFLFVSLALPFFWQLPTTPSQWWYLFAMAVVAGVAEILIIKALEVAEVAVVAPIHYTIIVWATMYGYLVWSELPDFWTLVGTAIIVSAGIYTLQRGKLKQPA